jgi:hypothetical protein
MLAGRLFVDDNFNFRKDASDTSVEGTSISITRSGQVIATTTTDANGEYSFDGLTTGYYIVNVEADPAGRDFTRGNVGTDDTIDSDVWTTLSDGTGITGAFLITETSSMLTADIGLDVIA